MEVTLALLTGTAALVSQVTGAVPTSGAIRAIVATITAYVPLTLAAAIRGVRRVSTPTVNQVAAIAPATVLTTAAVALRIPTIGRHCEP